MLGVTEQTLRNWDRHGRLPASRHPINGYRLYRVADVRELVHRHPRAAAEPDLGEAALTEEDLPAAHWSAAVALDPKHRPQAWDLPATTVRRDWRKFPQEAHVIRADGRAYR